MCYCGRRSCWKDLYAHLLHQQHLPNCKSFSLQTCPTCYTCICMNVCIYDHHPSTYTPNCKSISLHSPPTVSAYACVCMHISNTCNTFPTVSHSLYIRTYHTFNVYAYIHHICPSSFGFCLLFCVVYRLSVVCERTIEFTARIFRALPLAILYSMWKERDASN